MYLFFSFATSITVSLVLVPIIRNFALRFGVLDNPKDDRWHKNPTPKVGGIGIFLAFIIAQLISVIIAQNANIQWALMAGSGIIFIIGVVDDLRSLSPASKLIGQIFAASIVIFFGRNLEFFDLEILNIIFTLGWLVGITNAINLLDNMDGLAGGVALIAAIMLSLMFWQVKASDLLIIALALGGATLGFLFYNFPPATVFMGDAGSLFLGFTLASLAIAEVPRASNLLAILGVPTLIFLLPILDTSMVTITRILRGQSPAQGGKDHTSHRLIAFGLSERQTVLVLYGVALFSGIMGSLLESIDYNVSLLLIPILLLIFTLLTAYLARIKVVESSIIPEESGTLTKLMIGITSRGRVFEIFLDLVIICVSYFLAFWIYIGSGQDIIVSGIFLTSLPVIIGSVYISYFVFGIYRRIWQYIVLKDFLRFLLAVVGSTIVIKVVLVILYPNYEYAWSLLLLFGIFLFLGLVASRISFRILDQFFADRSRDVVRSVSVIIYGADDAGVMALQWLDHDADSHFKIIGFLDDDPFKRGRQIREIPVIGNLNDLTNSIENYDFQGIIFPSKDSINVFKESGGIEFCKDRDIWLRRLKINIEAVE